MSILTDFLSQEFIQAHATPSNIKLGREIADDGIIEFVQSSPSKIIAKVSLPGKSSTRTVEMKALKTKLNYKCTCSAKPDWFCKHCVATGLTILEKAPKRKN